MITTLIIFYILVCFTIFVLQRKLQYFPSKKLDDLAAYQLNGFLEYKLVTQDNIEIMVWFKASEKSNKILVYFHGNAGNIGDRSHKLRVFSKNSDYGILAVSYRGYGRSKGHPTEAGLLKDAKAATDFLYSQGYHNKDIILYGESLGSGVAVQHAVNINPAGLILESPFYSVVSLAKRTYWYLPVNLLLKDRFNSYKYALKINSPIIIFHGTKDSIVPYKSGKLLYEQFSNSSKKEFITIKDGGHINFDEMLLINQIKKFFNDTPADSSR